MFYGAVTLWFAGLWLAGRHSSEGGGMPLDWTSLELVAAMGASLTSMVALAKPVPRLRIPGAVAVTIFHSIIWLQGITESMQTPLWVLLPIGYSLALIGGLIFRHRVSRSTRPN